MQGVVPEDPEESFRRGYEHAAIEVFHAIERFLDPSTREALRIWIEEDGYVWRLNAMLDYPPTWRLKMLARPSREGLPEQAPSAGLRAPRDGPDRCVSLKLNDVGTIL